MYCIDNEALYDICQRVHKQINPTYSHLNNILANAMALATSFRFSAADTNLRSLCCNLTPFPRLHFYTWNLAPLLPEYSSVSEIYNQVNGVHILSDNDSQLFDASSSLVACNPKQGKYLSAVADLGPNFHFDQNEMLKNVNIFSTQQLLISTAKC